MDMRRLSGPVVTMDTDTVASTNSELSNGGTPWAWPLIAAMTVASVIAVVVPQLDDESTFSSLPPAVEDFQSQPQIAWEAQGGEVCGATDDNTVVLSTPDRVWAMDLLSGETTWSVDLSAAFTRVSCLDGAHLVAVSEVSAYATVLGIQLFQASSGGEVARLSGQSTVQVIPLGNNLGLLGTDHVLEMVKPDELDVPLWSRRLPGPAGRLDTISVRRIDSQSVQLDYSVFRDLDDSSSLMSAVLSVDDGRTPVWADDTPAEIHSYESVGDIIVRNDGGGYVETVVAFDRQGRELWRTDDARAMIVGTRVFLASQRDWDSWSQLREVAPLSGIPINPDTFTGKLKRFLPTVDGRAMVLTADELHVFDELFRPTASVPSTGFRFLFQGTDHFYLGRDVSSDVEHDDIIMTAFAAGSSSPSWTLELESGQTVQQVGTHLVVLDGKRGEMFGLQKSG